MRVKAVQDVKFYSEPIVKRGDVGHIIEAKKNDYVVKWTSGAKNEVPHDVVEQV
ncbi:MAG: hypothetical protein ABIH48_01080 [Candidatus Falkowbacteria bacterium]